MPTWPPRLLGGTLRLDHTCTVLLDQLSTAHHSLTPCADSRATSRHPAPPGMASLAASSVWQARQCFSSSSRPHKRARGALRVQATSWVSPAGMQPRGLTVCSSCRCLGARRRLPAVELSCRRRRRLPPAAAACCRLPSIVPSVLRVWALSLCPIRILRACSRRRRSRA